jgi:chaperonin cofactor prefoldin
MNQEALDKLCEVLQELSERVEELEERLAEFEDQGDDLEATAAYLDNRLDQHNDRISDLECPK